MRLVGHTTPLNSVAFSPNGKLIATAGGGTTTVDNTARLWDASNGSELFILRGHTQGVLSVFFSSDCLKLLTASEDGSVRTWDTRTGKQLQQINGPAPFRHAVFSPRGTRIATASAASAAIRQPRRPVKRLWRGRVPVAHEAARAK